MGLVLNPETPVDAVLPYLDEIDLLLVMSVHPGWGGQAFIPEVLDKVRVARREIDAHRLAGRDRDRRWDQRRHRARRRGRRASTSSSPGSAVFQAPTIRSAAARAILAAAARGGQRERPR